MLNFEHESLESHESFVFKQLIRVIRVPKKNDKQFVFSKNNKKFMFSKNST